MKLSSSQQAVVDAGSEPLLVIAGPGAGKTTVLAARIIRLLESSARSNRKILGITYTNVAARNLRERVNQSIDDTNGRVLVATFHGFATRILQQHGSHIGLRPDFSIINENEDRLELLSRAASSINVSRDYVSSRGDALLRLLARLYERCLTGQEAEGALVGYEDRTAVALFEPYIQQSVVEGQLEFSLLVQLCNRLLLRFPPIARQIRKVYEHICVDEFQDTNEMQYRLLDILAGDDSSGLVFLADQDQVIYQWNGASPARLREASERFHLKLLLLPTSYRCPDNIVRAAALLISKNSARFAMPPYDSDAAAGADIDVCCFGDERQEAEWLAGRLAGAEASSWGEIAVLARNRRLLEVALTTAVAQGVAAVSPIAKYEFGSAPLVMLQSMLRLANQPGRQAVMRRLTTAFYMMTGREVDADILAAKAEESSVDALTAFIEETLPHAQSAQFRELALAVKSNLIARKEYRDMSRIFFDWVDALPATGLKVAYGDDYAAERPMWEDLERRHHGLRAERVTLAEFLRLMDLESKANEPTGCVRFMTVHGAKGLEFKSVYLVGAAEGQFPAFQATKAGARSDAFEEERRSFFVAVTRTIEKLTITYARQYFGFHAERSRFIGEMGLPDRIA